MMAGLRPAAIMNQCSPQLGISNRFNQVRICSSRLLKNFRKRRILRDALLRKAPQDEEIQQVSSL
jgi:hypothetical protein